jgi:hypothetical protein
LEENLLSMLGLSVTIVKRGPDPKSPDKIRNKTIPELAHKVIEATAILAMLSPIFSSMKLRSYTQPNLMMYTKLKLT